MRLTHLRVLRLTSYAIYWHSRPVRGVAHCGTSQKAETSGVRAASEPIPVIIMSKLLTTAPRIYLGTMTFGWNQASLKVDDAVARAMVERFVALGGRHVDTARIYSAGDCEPIVGRAIKGMEGIIIGTKAAPSQPGGLSTEGIQRQLDASFAAMGIEAVDEYYLHQPDTESALLESLRKTHELVSAGRVRKLGLSNFHADEVARCFALCEEHGLTKPAVYQGLYNPLNRMVEAELLPLLRKHGCSFVAYNPLGAGMLTGRHIRGSEPPAGRFKDNPNYIPR